MNIHRHDHQVTVWHADCLNVLATLPDNTIDAVCTDPPYSLGFMSAKWDTHDTPLGFQQWCELWARECLRVLKPGGHLLAFGGTRTWHRLTVAVEDAGFEIRDSIAWLYGSGFPKSLDISKAIDKASGNKGAALGAFIKTSREATGLTRQQAAAAVFGKETGAFWNWEEGLPQGKHPGPTPGLWPRIKAVIQAPDSEWDALLMPADREVIGERTTGIGTGKGAVSYIADSENRDITAPAAPAAQQWTGWGTALKPAHEPIVVARKPLQGTVAANVLAHGVGALNIDATRVGTTGATSRSSQAPYPKNPDGTEDRSQSWARTGHEVVTVDKGRWPTNVTLDGHAAAELDATGPHTKDGVAVKRNKDAGKLESNAVFGERAQLPGADQTFGSEGGPSRFFPVFKYQAKAPTRERPTYTKQDASGTTGPIAASRCRNCGKQDLSGSRCQCPQPDWTREGGNKVAHPTCKPLALMRWLVRLVCPPGGTVLDPFAGSGTTTEACIHEGLNCITVEQEADYLPLIDQRINRARHTTTATNPTLFDDEDVS